MNVQVNYLAVLVAAILNMILGAIWFGPLFGKKWAKLAGFTEERMKEVMQKGMGKSYSIMFLGSLLMALVLNYSIIFVSFYFQISGVSAGVMTAFLNWIGFVAPVTIGSVLWENKSWAYWFITYSYYLVGLVLMGMVLAAWV